MSTPYLVLVESNTTGSGRLFCAAARRLGLRPLVMTADPARYPYLASDAIEHRRTDTRSPAAVLDAVATLPGPLAGVTSSSEYYIATAAEVARAHGRPHPDPAAVRRCRDKSSQRAALAAAGVPQPAFRAAATIDAAVAAACAVGLPVVCKPTTGSGSVAVRLCHTPDEVRAAAARILAGDPAALGLPAPSAVLIERYVPGAEFSVETFDADVVGITRKHLGPEPHFVEVGHDFPAPLPASQRERIAEVTLAALRALGLGWGPAHVELRWSADGPVVIEVNPRLAGGMIPRVVEVATGLDLITMTVARAAGCTPEAAPTGGGAAAIRFLVAERSGWLERIDGLEAAGRQRGVAEVGMPRPPGYRVERRHSFQDRLAYVIAAGADAAAAGRAAEAALDLLRPALRSGVEQPVASG